MSELILPNYLPDIFTGISTQEDTPSFECEAYRCMRPMWCLVEDLLGGTIRMRQAGPRWLPKEEKEDWLHYSLRLQRSVLYNGFGDTVTKLAARPFSKPLTINSSAELPPQIKWLLDDCDHLGTSLTKFCHDFFEESVEYGISHVLVDYSIVPAGTTLADEREKKLGPYFVKLDTDDVFFWEYTDGVLTKLRYREERTVAKGAFSQECEKYVIEWTQQEVREYKMDGSKVIGEPKITPHTHKCIPLFTFYTKKTGVMEAAPPMEDLAWMNVAHWQSYSDQRNILRFARLGIIFMSGVSPNELDKEVILAANKVIKSTEKDAKMVYVEHSGKAIAAGHTDVLTLEEKMLVLGMQPLFETSGTATATGRAMDESRSQSLAQSWVIEFEETLEAMFKYAAQLINKPLDTEFHIVIDKEFSLSMKAGLDVQALIALRAAGEIDRETLLEELKRRSVLADTTNITEVIKLAKAEGPSISKMPANGQDQKNQGNSKKQAGAQSDPTTNPAGL